MRPAATAAFVLIGALFEAWDVVAGAVVPTAVTGLLCLAETALATVKGGGMAVRGVANDRGLGLVRVSWREICGRFQK